MADARRYRTTALPSDRGGGAPYGPGEPPLSAYPPRGLQALVEEIERLGECRCERSPTQRRRCSPVLRHENAAMRQGDGLVYREEREVTHGAQRHRPISAEQGDRTILDQRDAVRVAKAPGAGERLGESEGVDHVERADRLVQPPLHVSEAEHER